MDVELLEILFVVRVPDVDNGMVRLRQRGVEDIVVRGCFIGKALAVEIDLQPRIRTHPEQGADRVRPAELIGFYSNAVEDHRGVDFVHVRARPQARLDAVARGAVDGDGEGVLVHGLRLQGFEHIFIACIAARADHCALACVDFDIAVGSFGDCARYRAAFVLDKLDHRGVEAEFDALGFCVIAQDDFAVDDIGKAGEFGVGSQLGIWPVAQCLYKSSRPSLFSSWSLTCCSCLAPLAFRKPSSPFRRRSMSKWSKRKKKGGGDGVEGSLEERCRRLAEDACLTEREREVFLLLVHGRNARYIQETLVVSYNTVKTHVSHVYAKLGVHSHQELIDLVESKG